LVEESLSAVPWLYVNAGGIEFLSRCSSSVTRELVEAWLQQLQLVRVLVPEEFGARRDVPTVFVLYAQDVQQAMSVEIQRDLQKRAKAVTGEVNLAPSMRLSDRDLDATISYVDESKFDAAGLSVTSFHVRHHLRGRVPALPAWVLDGFERALRPADFRLQPITPGAITSMKSTASEAPGRDP